MAQFGHMDTLVVNATKKSAQKILRETQKRKFSKYAFGPAARKYSGMIRSGIGNLSTRVGFAIFN